MPNSVRLKLIPLLIALTTIMSSCASRVLSSEDLTRLRQAPKVYAVHNPSRLGFALFPEEGLNGESIGKYFGPVGLIAGGMSDLRSAQTLGERLLQEYSIQDPVLLVKAKSIALLARENINNIQAFDSTLPEDNSARLKQAVDSSVIIDFKTITWVLQSLNKNPRHYADAYQARSRLIRVEDGKVLWEGECSIKTHDAATAPTLAQLTSNQGALLKSLFQADADACADEIVAQFLGKPTQP